jgi:hypothetical protein
VLHMLQLRAKERYDTRGYSVLPSSFGGACFWPSSSKPTYCNRFGFVAVGKAIRR